MPRYSSHEPLLCFQEFLFYLRFYYTFQKVNIRSASFYEMNLSILFLVVIFSGILINFSSRHVLLGCVMTAK